MSWSRQRLYATLVFLGAGFLFLRTIRMITQDALVWMVPWVAVLLLAESVLDLMILVGAVRWWVTQVEEYASFPLRTTAAAVFLHAVRVLIYALGRIGPWIDFDIRPEHRAVYSLHGSMGWVYFASIMSVLGILGVIIIWRNRKRSRKITEINK
jgi:predicted tellurium resistance membrane protein TerC